MFPEFAPLWRFFQRGSKMERSERVLVDGLAKEYEKRESKCVVPESPDVMQLLLGREGIDGDRVSTPTFDYCCSGS